MASRRFIPDDLAETLTGINYSFRRWRDTSDAYALAELMYAVRWDHNARKKKEVRKLILDTCPPDFVWYHPSGQRVVCYYSPVGGDMVQICTCQHYTEHDSCPHMETPDQNRPYNAGYYTVLRIANPAWVRDNAMDFPWESQPYPEGRNY